MFSRRPATLPICARADSSTREFGSVLLQPAQVTVVRAEVKMMIVPLQLGGFFDGLWLSPTLIFRMTVSVSDCASLVVPADARSVSPFRAQAVARHVPRTNTEGIAGPPHPFPDA
jgi:hypothetical protein